MPTPTSSIGGSSAFVSVFDSIASGAVANFDATGIAATASHLWIVLQARGDTAATATGTLLRFNADSGANYQYTQIFSDGATNSTSRGTAVTSIDLGATTAASGTAGYAAVLQAMIPNYASTTFHKQLTMTGFEVDAAGAGNTQTRTLGGTWHDTSAISRITITPNAGNWIAGSRLTIYALT